jgi:hypothetical protein
VSSRKNSKRGSDVSGTHFLTTHHDDMHQLPLVRPSTTHELRNARPVTPRALFHFHMGVTVAGWSLEAKLCSKLS